MRVTSILSNKNANVLFLRNTAGFSLLETMTVIAVLAIVTGLLYAYSQQGWGLFYQSYGRGLSQVKAKLAIKVLSEDLRNANKSRLVINGTASTYGIPFPDDALQTSPYIYFTKPCIFEPSGDVIAYDFVLYYFANPLKQKNDFSNSSRRKSPRLENFYVLKSVKYLNQSKTYTEDAEKIWPFPPPILEIKKSTLLEDKQYLYLLKKKYETSNDTSAQESDDQEVESSPAPELDDFEEEDLYVDPVALLQKDRRNIPVNGNFSSTSLTDPFSSKDAKITFIDDYKNDKLITIDVKIQESPFLLGLMGAMSEFQVSVTPRN